MIRTTLHPTANKWIVYRSTPLTSATFYYHPLYLSIIFISTKKFHGPLLSSYSFSLNSSSEPDCPTLEEADTFSQTQLVKTLTHNCRYDRLERPKSEWTTTQWPFPIKFPIKHQSLPLPRLQREERTTASGCIRPRLCLLYSKSGGAWPAI